MTGARDAMMARWIDGGASARPKPAVLFNSNRLCAAFYMYILQRCEVNHSLSMATFLFSENRYHLHDSYCISMGQNANSRSAVQTDRVLCVCAKDSHTINTAMYT